MTTTQRLAQALLAGVLALGMAGTAMADKQGRNTVIGAGIGGVAGAVLSEGDPWMTLGGAAAGGVLGHVLTDDDRRDRKRWDRGDRHRDHYKRADYRKHDRMRGKGHHKHRHHR